VLAEFVRIHPLVDLALTVDLSATLYQMLDAGDLDLALCKRRGFIFPASEISAQSDWPPSGREMTLIVNATPIRDEVLVELSPGQQVVDLAYKQDGSDTAMVAAARKAGCKRVVDGLEILLGQGAASFERWTGIQAPVPVMRAALSR